MASPQRRRTMMSTFTGMFSQNNASSAYEPKPTPPASSSLTPVSLLSFRRRSTDHGGALAASNLSKDAGAQQQVGSELKRSKSGSNSNSINAEKATAANAERESELRASSKDLLFRYQIALTEPRRLGPEAFHAAGVAANRAVSARIHAVLQRHNIISTAPGDYRIYADRITRQLPRQLPFLQPSELHRMVGMLFYWEEEQSRWNLIDQTIESEKKSFQQETGIDVLGVGAGSAGNATTEASESATTDAPRLAPAVSADADGNVDDDHSPPLPTYTGEDRMHNDMARQSQLEQHKLTIAHLENEKRTPPSLREVLKLRQSGSIPIDHQHNATRPPAYGDSHNSVPVMGSPSREDLSLITSFTEASDDVGRGPNGVSQGTIPEEGSSPSEKEDHASAAAS